MKLTYEKVITAIKHLQKKGGSGWIKEITPKEAKQLGYNIKPSKTKKLEDILK